MKSEGFISYEYVFDNFQEGDSFYDRKLLKFEFLSKKDFGLIKQINLIDENGKFSSVYNYTKLSRILISMGLFKRLKKCIFWDKQILLTEKMADDILDDTNNQIIEEYIEMLKNGVENGIISNDEYNELIHSINN